MTPTPTDRPSRPAGPRSRWTRPRGRTTTRPGTRHLIVRRAATGVLIGVAAASAAALTASVLAQHPSQVPLALKAHTVSPPSPVPAAHREVRASRSRTTAVAKRTAIPTMQVTKTVGVGPSFSGQASWYGGSFDGQRTASGERFDTSAYTAASKTLPFGTELRVCHDGCVVVRINDRGPYVGGRVLDLTRAASSAIGFSGVANVTATPIGERTVTVVDTVKLHALRKHEAHVAHLAHAAKVLRSQQLRARAVRLEAVRRQAQVPTEGSPAAGSGTVPTPASGAALLGSSAGLVLLRRRRP